MPVIFYFLQGFALAFPSMVSPSSFKIFLISEALQHGWRRTLPVAFTPLITDGPIFVLALLILTQTPDWFLNALRFLGGLFILYLAKRILDNLKRGTIALKANEHVAGQSLLKAIGINLLNPNPYILWGVIAGPIVLDGWRRHSFFVGFGVFIGFYITFVAGLIALVFIFATAGKLNSRLNFYLSLLAAAALVLFGIYQIVVGGWALLA